MNFFIPWLLILFATKSVFANPFYEGVRGLGMGGAQVAIANDETSVLTNPNGLGRLRDKFVTILDPELTGGVNNLDELWGTSVFGSTNPQTLYDKLNTTSEEPFHSRMQLFPSVVLPGFGLGVLAKYDVRGFREATGNLSLKYTQDWAAVMGFNTSFAGGVFKFGATGRLVDRVFYEGSMVPSNLNLSGQATEGLGLAVDLAVTLTAPIDYLPTLSAVLRDTTGTNYNLSNGMFALNNGSFPSMTPQTLDVAAALFPIVGKGTRLTITAEYWDVMNALSSASFMDKFHAGMEANFWDHYFVRAGMYQSNWTAGFEYALGTIQVQFATYGEKHTINITEVNDRKFTLKLALRL